MGLTLNTSNGQITLSSSTAGNYEVTRTVTNTPGNLSTSATDIVIINPADSAAFSYSGSPYDIASASNPTPTVTGLPGGTFSSTRDSFTFSGTASRGNTSYIDTGYTGINNSTEFSMSFWLKTEDINATTNPLQDNSFFGNRTSGGPSNDGISGQLHTNINNNKIFYFYVDYPTSWVTFNPGLTNNDWINLVIFYNGSFTGSDSATQNAGRFKVYLNGSPKSLTFNGNIPSSISGTTNNNLWIGSGPRVSYGWSGEISNFALWNTNQVANINNIYNSGTPQVTYNVNPTIWYKTDGSSTFSSGTWTLPNAANPGTNNGTGYNLPQTALNSLDINSTTGLISLSSSSLGTFPVTYDTTGATGSLCPATSTQSVQLVNTNFNFPSAVCNATGSPDVAPTNFIFGQGGSFSMTPSSGLAINNNSSSANFGTISPAGSTPGTYTIKYEIGNNFTTKDVTSSSVLAPLTTTNTSTLSFNGTSSYIDAGSSSDFQFQASDSFTISAWIYPTVSKADRQMIIGNRNWATNPYQGWDLRTSLQGGINRIEMTLDSGTTYAQYYTTTGVSLNQWHHVIVVYDASLSTIGDRFSFYSNGSLVGKAANYAQIPATTTYATKLTIGAIQDQNGSEYAFWNGKIDEVAIWNRVLTSCDAVGIYQASSNGTTADLSTVYPSNLKYYNRMGD
jgi:hypothetical protein